MLKVNSYSVKGVKGTSISLPKEWEVKNNPILLAQALRVYIDKSHVGLRKTQTRAEVSRTTKKLYKQKGTGGARHGSRKAPIFVGGGVALGPRPVKRELKLNSALRRRALGVAISEAVKNKKVIAADIEFKKTKEAQNFINKVLGKKSTKVTFVLKKQNLVVNKFLRNMKNASIKFFPAINAYDIFFGGMIVLDKSIFVKETKKK